ncbi:DUF3043 domain-containing protein [Leucobacter sp. gxy201]|uniref:DUF3043 domain-containing protein n=1 Tax=Leucobacter sp. gxy201 TaxID=2957200 RepID=UPI003DA07C72
MAETGAEEVGNGKEKATAGKGRPTPSRKQAEAANARPIVGSKDKSVLKEQRRAQNEARERARIGMLQGEERYLMPRDRGPQRRFVRDYVDARWSIGEFLIPMMLVVLVLTFIPGTLQLYSLYIVWGFVGLAVLDAVLLGLRLQRKLTDKFGEGKVEKGFRWYAAMRAFQFRPMRAPKPQNKRGAFPS